MPTSFHIPPELLKQIDQRAGRLRISRNKYVVRVLQRTIGEEEFWNEGFEEALKKFMPEEAKEELDSSIDKVLESRKSKKNPPF